MWRTFSPRPLLSNNPGRVTSCRDLGLRMVGFQPAPRPNFHLKSSANLSLKFCGSSSQKLKTENGRERKNLSLPYVMSIVKFYPIGFSSLAVEYIVAAMDIYPSVMYKLGGVGRKSPRCRWGYSFSLACIGLQSSVEISQRG